MIFSSVSSALPSPRYVLEESRLRANLSLIHSIAERSGVEFILAFKAFALWRTFPVFREYISHTTASSLYEARLATEEFGTKAHTYSPAYENETFGRLAGCSSHLTFNSLTQYERFHNRAAGVSLGLRVNPEYSEIETELYNPCAPGSRFGILAEQLPARLPEDIRGLHFHCHCESDSYALERTLARFEEKFSPWFSQVDWVNFGGGHLVTRADYDVNHLVGLLSAFRSRHPHLRVILEPGSAFAWQTGTLCSRVVDIVENRGVRTAILNVSFTCHMPDCLEMPYTPRVLGADICGPDVPGAVRLGGNSCLSGDFMGWWRFEKPLKVGDEVVFDDMIHYTTVKTNMFNGIHHPALCLQRMDGRVEVLREFTYEDYRDRMD